MTAILRRLLAAGLIAGLLAGTLVTLVQRLQVVPLILAAEAYEEAAAAPAAHDHGAAPGGTSDHHHQTQAWAPADGWERTGFTWLANMLTGVGYGLVLAAAMGFAGRPVDWRRGLLWGGAGYLAFAVAPALGLPPELPGMMAADLPARQIWWLMAAGGTVAGLALVVFAPQHAWRRPVQVAGLAVMVLPHLVGAPHEPAAGPVPAELAARFVVASLVVSAVFWAALGAALGHLMRGVLRNGNALAARPGWA